MLKQNAFELLWRKMRILLMELSGGRHALLYLLHLYRMWCQVSRVPMPHGQRDSSRGKNRCLYSPMGAWLVISRVILAHVELE